jgi:hypothetical protein
MQELINCKLINKTRKIQINLSVEKHNENSLEQMEKLLYLWHQNFPAISLRLFSIQKYLKFV